MVSKEFAENILSEDVVTVRSALLDYLIIDRTFKSFDEALAYASSRLPVIEEHDGEEFEPETAWDMRYVNLQKAALCYNFSQARIDHIKKVIAKVMPIEASPTVTDKPSGHVQEKKRMSGGRTGRRIVEETVHQPDKHTPCQEPPQSIRKINTCGKTGKRVVSEKECPENDPWGSKSHQGFDITPVVIFGGVAIAAAGVLAAEPVTFAAGAAIAGTAYIVKTHGHK